jgi:hypothetical protein
MHVWLVGLPCTVQLQRHAAGATGCAVRVPVCTLVLLRAGLC